MSKVLFAVIVLNLVGWTVVQGATLTVKLDGTGNYTAIQPAITAAADGDQIVVYPGTYVGANNRSLNFNYKALTLRGSNPDDPAVAAATIIDCQHAGTGITLYGVPSKSSLISGLTVINGTGQGIDYSGSGGVSTVSHCVLSGHSGAGIRCAYSGKLRVGDCTVSQNSGWGITTSGMPTTTLTITRCRITGNSLGGVNSMTYAAVGIRQGQILGNSGPGVSVHDEATATIFSSLIARNAGGVSCYFGTATVTNCTLSGNSATAGGGVCCNDALVSISNSILWGNTAVNGHELALISGGLKATLHVNYSQVDGGSAAVYTQGTGGTLDWGPGNAASDPLFIDADGPDNNPATWSDNNYHIPSASPCVNTGARGATVISADTTTAAGTTVTFRVGDTSPYAVGDEIEYDYDSVLRTLAAVDNGTGTLTVAAALSAGSLAGKRINYYGGGDLDENDRILFGYADKGAYEMAGSTVSGAVYLGDYTGNVSTEPITIEILCSPVETQTVRLDATSHYSLTTIQQGTYDITARGHQWLRQRWAGVTLGSNPVNFTLINGDVDSSNTVDAADLAAVLAAMDTGNTGVDLDGDRTVTSTDLAIVLARMYTNGQ